MDNNQESLAVASESLDNDPIDNLNLECDQLLQDLSVQFNLDGFTLMESSWADMQEIHARVFDLIEQYLAILDEEAVTVDDEFVRLDVLDRIQRLNEMLKLYKESAVSAAIDYLFREGDTVLYREKIDFFESLDDLQESGLLEEFSGQDMYQLVHSRFEDAGVRLTYTPNIDEFQTELRQILGDRENIGLLTAESFFLGKYLADGVITMEQLDQMEALLREFEAEDEAYGDDFESVLRNIANDMGSGNEEAQTLDRLITRDNPEGECQIRAEFAYIRLFNVYGNRLNYILQNFGADEDGVRHTRLLFGSAENIWTIDQNNYQYVGNFEDIQSGTELTAALADDDPLVAYYIREYLGASYNTYVVPGYEGVEYDVVPDLSEYVPLTMGNGNALRPYGEENETRFETLLEQERQSIADLDQFDRQMIEDEIDNLESNPTLDNYLELGISYYNLGLYNLAIEVANQGLQSFPSIIYPLNEQGVSNDSITLLRMRADASFNAGYILNARRDYTQIISLLSEGNDRLISVYFNRGMAKNRLQDFEGAIQDFNTGLDLYSENSRAYRGRGWSYENLGNLEQAVADYEQSISLQFDWDVPYFDLYAIYSDRPDLGDANEIAVRFRAQFGREIE